MIDKRAVVVWIYDTKGWAFGKIADELIARLPSFRHMKIFKDRVIGVNVQRIRDVSDIIVIFHPYDLRYFKSTDNVVVRLDSYRGLEKCKIV